MFSSLKFFLKKSPVAFSKNHRYDILTKKIIQQYCHVHSNCIDVGAHKGEVTDLFLKLCPQGMHFSFEPIPFLFENFKKKYAFIKNCKFFEIALSDEKGISSFNYVISNPAYSGLKKRTYDRKNEKDITIEVHTDTLDHCVPSYIKIDFIKIDVEGAEMKVLQGGKKILAKDHPIIVFEFGIGGSDFYGTTPQLLYSFFKELNYEIFLLENFLSKKNSLSLGDLEEQFLNRKNYYFVAG